MSRKVGWERKHNKIYLFILCTINKYVLWKLCIVNFRHSLSKIKNGKTFINIEGNMTNVQSSIYIPVFPTLKIQ